MTESNKTAVNSLRNFTDKLFGGINMSWIKVILFAVIAAAVTALFMILPIFNNTSFREIGVTFEAWILFAIIIMVNSKSPLDSALKVFVFFLISQPLIYLFQVPFSYMGWSLFGYYRTWFIWTLCTFPAAYIGWYLKKGNWLSLLILTPINILLASLGWGFFSEHLIYDFPSHLLSVLFCFGQIVVYLLVFFRGWKKRLSGAAAVAAAILFLTLTTRMFDVSVRMPLPGDPVLSDTATVRLLDESYGEVSLSVTDGEGYIYVHMTKAGEVGIIVTDGDKEYGYLAVTMVENGIKLIDILPAEDASP